MSSPHTDLIALCDTIDGAGSPTPISKALRLIAQIVASADIPINASLTINLANCGLYFGRTLTLSGAYTITLALDLHRSFQCAVNSEGHTASVASDGTTLLGGATTTLTRTGFFAIIGDGPKSFTITGA